MKDGRIYNKKDMSKAIKTLSYLFFENVVLFYCFVYMGIAE